MARREKGQPKIPGSGRKKGTPNKFKAQIQDRLAELKCDPVEILVKFAKGDWKGLGYAKENGGPFGSLTIPPSLRAKCAETLVGKIAPDLKAIEFRPPAPTESTRTVFETEWRTVEHDDGDKGPAALPADGRPAQGAIESAPVQGDPVRPPER